MFDAKAINIKINSVIKIRIKIKHNISFFRDSADTNWQHSTEHEYNLTPFSKVYIYLQEKIMICERLYQLGEIISCVSQTDICRKHMPFMLKYCSLYWWTCWSWQTWCFLQISWNLQRNKAKNLNMKTFNILGIPIVKFHTWHFLISMWTGQLFICCIEQWMKKYVTSTNTLKIAPAKKVIDVWTKHTNVVC